MAQPKVLLVLTEFPPSFGGMQTHAVYLCRHLVERGYRIEVATYRGEGADSIDCMLPYPVHRRLSRISFWENLRVLSDLARSTGAELIYTSTIFYGVLRELTGLPVLCRSAGNDVLRPWIVWPFRPFSSVVCRPWIEDFLYERFRKLDWPERFELWLLDQRRAAMCRSAHLMSRVLANSDFTAGLLQSIGVDPGRIRVMPGGVDAIRFHPVPADRNALRRKLGLPPAGYILMTACRLVAKKGLDLLLRSLARLRRTMKDVCLVVIGDGRERGRCERLAAELDVGSAVVFAGRVPHDRVHEYFWCADQFILASREHVDRKTGLRDVETMGRVLCEANAAGIPVVAARSGGIPSVIRHGTNGLLFREDSETQLIARVERIRDDRRLARRMCDNGLRIAADEFDWSVIGEIHEREFGLLLNGGDSAGFEGQGARRHLPPVLSC